jgi:hypothetical protein
VQWWEWTTLAYKRGDEELPVGKWVDLSGDRASLTRKADPDWPEANRSKGPGELSEFFAAMETKGKAQGATGCIGASTTTDRDFPHYYPRVTGGALVPGDAHARRLFGVVRFYSGCPEGKKGEVRWMQEVGNDREPGHHAWPASPPSSPLEAPMPQDEPPLNPAAGQGLGGGTAVSDQQADQPDQHTGETTKYGSGEPKWSTVADR